MVHAFSCVCVTDAFALRRSVSPRTPVGAPSPPPVAMSNAPTHSRILGVHAWRLLIAPLLSCLNHAALSAMPAAAKARCSLHTLGGSAAFAW